MTKRGGFICITKHVCNRTRRRKVSIILMDCLVVIDMPALIVSLQDKQQRAFPFLCFSFLILYLTLVSGQVHLHFLQQYRKRELKEMKQISNRSHLSIIIFGLYCMFTRRTYKMEPHSGNLITSRALNIEAVPLCSVTPRPRPIESGYEGKLS